MKRDLEKMKRIKECIKQFYTSVSDRKIAIKFATSVRAIQVMRLRMGLVKTAEVSDKLRKGVKKIKRIGNSNERVIY